MKIAVIIERYDPGAGGNERSTAQIVERLTARGHDVTVLAGKSPGEKDDGGAHVERGGAQTKSGLGVKLFANWAESRLDEFDTAMSVTMAVAAPVVQPRGGTVRETLEANIRRRPTPRKRRLKRIGHALRPKLHTLLGREQRTLTHPRLRQVVSISSYVTRQLAEHYNVPAEKIAEVPNAAAIQAMTPDERTALRGETRRAWRLNDDDIVFLFAALNPGLKGRGELLRAMRVLIRREPRARLLLAGQASLAATQQSAAMGLSECLRWVGPTQRMDALYAAADVTVLPTWYDPSSKVVLESLLHGKPAISTSFNGASDWIARDPKQPAGRVIDTPANIDALAQAMHALCDGDERARCAAATAGLDAQIGMDAHVEALEKVLIAAAT